MVSFATIKSSRVITSIKCQLSKQRNFIWTRALDNVASGFGRDPTCFLAKYWSIGITRGSYKISRDKNSRDKNVTDFNVADYMRRDIKVLMTKTHYTVHDVFLGLGSISGPCLLFSGIGTLYVLPQSQPFCKILHV